MARAGLAHGYVLAHPHARVELLCGMFPASESSLSPRALRPTMRTQVIGTDEMTTCIGVALRDPSSGWCVAGQLRAPITAAQC